MKFKTMLTAAAAAIALAGGSAQAAPCVAYLNGADPERLDTGNVTLNGREADGCFGHVDKAGLADNSVDEVVGYLNGMPRLSGGWSGILRADRESPGVGAYSGLEFQIVGLHWGTEDRTFTLAVRDLDGTTGPSLPLLIDLIVTLKAGKETDFYYFDDLKLGASNDGTYEVAITNWRGQAKALSDITLAGRDARSAACTPDDRQCNTNSVPEPATLLLASVALLSAAAAARRRR